MPTAFLKLSKSLRFLTEITLSALLPKMLLPRYLLTHNNNFLQREWLSFNKTPVTGAPMLLPSLGLTHNLVLLCLARHSTFRMIMRNDWNLYNLFIAWVARHLLAQRRFSYALKHSFMPPFAAKRVAPKPLGESFLGA